MIALCYSLYTLVRSLLFLGVEADEALQGPVEVVPRDRVVLQSEDYLILVFLALPGLVIQHHSFCKLPCGQQLLSPQLQAHFLRLEID